MLSGLAAAQISQIQVRVIDSQGGAIPQAAIRIHCAGAAATALTASSLGEADTACHPPADLLVSAPGFAPVRTTLTNWSEAQPQTVTLSPAMVRDSVDVVVSDSATVPVITSDTLAIDATGARTVFDAVERLVPGAFVTHRGVLGYGISTNGTGEISIRGVGESPNAAVLIVVDGRPDFQGEMGHPLPDFFSLTDVSLVSVTEGPASVLYGSNATGGVVEIDPIQPSAQNETRLTASLGSFLTGQYRLSNGGTFGHYFYQVTGGISHTDGDREDSHFREGDGAVSFGDSFSDHWKGSVDGRYGHFLVEDPGPVGDPSEANYAAVGRGGFSANLDNAYARTYGFIRVYGSYGRNFISDGFRSIDDATGIRLDQTFALNSTLLLEVGSDDMHYGGEAHEEPSGYSYGTHHIDEEAGFTFLQWTPIHGLRLNAGYRYQANSQFGRLSAPEASGSFAFSDRYSYRVQRFARLPQSDPPRAVPVSRTQSELVAGDDVELPGHLPRPAVAHVPCVDHGLLRQPAKPDCLAGQLAQHDHTECGKCDQPGSGVQLRMDAVAAYSRPRWVQLHQFHESCALCASQQVQLLGRNPDAPFDG
jgi:outer membrane receptor protein involved in Fe transport